MDESKQPGLQIGQIFLSVAEFAHREDALSLPVGTPVQMGINITISVQITEDGSTGLITVTVKSLDEQKPLYRFRVEMVGLVQVGPEMPNLPPVEYLSQQGPAMMFPFVREAMANLTGRGRFGALWLAPYNLQAVLTTTTGGNSPS